MAKDTYKYNGKEYERIPSKFKCLGCDFLDEETAKCDMPTYLGVDCMEPGKNFQFKEIKL